MIKNKLRKVIIARISAGKSKAAIAKVLNMNASTIHKAWKV